MKYLFSLFILMASATGLCQILEPGIWRAQSDFSLNGIPLPSSEDETCVTKEEAKDAKTTIAKELKKNGCELTKWSSKSSHLDASLKCQNQDLNAKGSLKGNFTNKSYELNGTAKGTYKEMISSSAVLKLKGKWIKACPQ